MTWQLAASVLCYLAAGAWMYRVSVGLDRLVRLLMARERLGFREELLEAARRFHDDPPTATILIELAGGLLTIDEIHDQWVEQKMGASE